MYGDIVLIGEFLGYVVIVGKIVFFEIVQCGVGEYDVEIKGVVGVIVFVYCNVGVWMLFFEQNCSIEICRFFIDDCDFYGSFVNLFGYKIILSLK